MTLFICSLMVLSYLSYKNDMYRLKLSKMNEIHNMHLLKKRVAQLEKQKANL